MTRRRNRRPKGRPDLPLSPALRDSLLRLGARDASFISILSRGFIVGQKA